METEPSFPMTAINNPNYLKDRYKGRNYGPYTGERKLKLLLRAALKRRCCLH